ncbi:uncharacterized protein BKCO1_300025 [Diplodia corticola]|uniref:Uncharacterized protein n=1 Tax=Diplodia corticola TaxID=236234 RepID=A0A1J9SHA3_9PEZI|nr:uncharacterized protein BKCO1_300025 [Diplodia corticola]OJD38965.1 hypothetical protein BKCO1_300025 [Diplodia corticola]
MAPVVTLPFFGSLDRIRFDVALLPLSHARGRLRHPPLQTDQPTQGTDPTARFFPPTSPSSSSASSSTPRDHHHPPANFALTFRIDSTRQYLIINDQQPISIRNTDPSRRFSSPISIADVPVGDPAPAPPSAAPARSAILTSFLRTFPFPPWFLPADATLLAWSLRPASATAGTTTATIKLRASWSAATDPDGFGGPMEIWPDGESWYGTGGTGNGGEAVVNGVNDDHHVDGSGGGAGGSGSGAASAGPPRGVRPLLTVTLVRSQIPGNDLIVGAPPLSVSPSATLAARRAALPWVFPAWVVGARVVGWWCGGRGGGAGGSGGGGVGLAAAMVVVAVVVVVLWSARRRALIADQGVGKAGGGAGRRDWRGRSGEGRMRSKNQSVDLSANGGGGWLGEERSGW